MTQTAGGALLRAGALLVCALACMAGDAAPPPADGSAVTLLQKSLPDVSGKEAVLLRVDYPPAAASLPHRHDADVFVYVLEGSVVMQVAGRPARTLTVGDTFYEGPADVHVQSANASSRAPARLLVFMVKNAGAPISRGAAAAQEPQR